MVTCTCKSARRAGGHPAPDQAKLPGGKQDEQQRQQHAAQIDPPWRGGVDAEHPRAQRGDLRLVLSKKPFQRQKLSRSRGKQRLKLNVIDR